MKSLTSYHLLGRSGLRISPFSLGTMNFGTEWGWGHGESEAKKIFDYYVDNGGNFIDTADGYTGGTSERLVGQYIHERKLRDQIVLATKYTFAAQTGNPNSGGNGRKNMMRALEGSLERLQTDYIDLYWVHAWDSLTPVEEVLHGLNSIVESGKVRYIGLSDVPAWYAARMQTMADWRGFERVCALQMEYNLVERSIEREHIPMALELGMGVCAWSPLASGLLTGKYKKTSQGYSGEGRLQTTKDSSNPVFKKFSDRNFAIAETLEGVAKEVGRLPAQVALNWVASQRGISNTIIGANSLEQLKNNLSALDFSLSDSMQKTLAKASALEPATPYMFFENEIRSFMQAGAAVGSRPIFWQDK